MTKMNGVAVPLDEQTHEVVRRIAYEERCSKAEVFRRALDRFLKSRERGKKEGVKQ